MIQDKGRADARDVRATDTRWAWLGLWMAATLLAASVFAGAASGQQPQSGGSTPTPDAGVIRPPASIDPGIKAKPPVPEAALPTPIVPPPGTPGGNASVQPK